MAVWAARCARSLGLCCSALAMRKSSCDFEFVEFRDRIFVFYAQRSHVEVMGRRGGRELALVALQWISRWEDIHAAALPAGTESCESSTNGDGSAVACPDAGRAGTGQREMGK